MKFSVVSFIVPLFMCLLTPQSLFAQNANDGDSLDTQYLVSPAQHRLFFFSTALRQSDGRFYGHAGLLLSAGSQSGTSRGGGILGFTLQVLDPLEFGANAIVGSGFDQAIVNLSLKMSLYEKHPFAVAAGISAVRTEEGAYTIARVLGTLYGERAALHVGIGAGPGITVSKYARDAATGEFFVGAEVFFLQRLAFILESLTYTARDAGLSRYSTGLRFIAPSFHIDAGLSITENRSNDGVQIFAGAGFAL